MMIPLKKVTGLSCTLAWNQKSMTGEFGLVPLTNSNIIQVMILL